MTEEYLKTISGLMQEIRRLSEFCDQLIKDNLDLQKRLNEKPNLKTSEVSR